MRYYWRSRRHPLRAAESCGRAGGRSPRFRAVECFYIKEGERTSHSPSVLYGLTNCERLQERSVPTVAGTTIPKPASVERGPARAKTRRQPPTAYPGLLPEAAPVAGVLNDPPVVIGPATARVTG